MERRDASVQAGSPSAPAPQSGRSRGESVLLTVPRPPACKKKQMIPSIQVFKEIDQRIIFEVRLSSSTGSFYPVSVLRVTLSVHLFCAPIHLHHLPGDIAYAERERDRESVQ